MVKRNIDILINARDRASAQMGRVTNSTEQFANKLARTSRSSGMFDARLIAIGGAATAAAAALAGLKASVNLAAEFEQTNVAFETLLGSADQAQLMVKQMMDLSIKTPFEPDELLATSKQLLAFGIETEKINGLVTNLGDLAAGSGAEITHLGSIMGKVYAKGRAQAEELNQFSEAGIPIIQEMAKMYGKTTAEILKMGEKGQLTYKDVEAAVRSLTSEGGKFNDMMEKQSKTAKGLGSTLSGSFKQVGRSIGQFFLPAIKEATSLLIDAANYTNDVLDGIAIFAGIKNQTIGTEAITKDDGIKEPYRFEKYKQDSKEVAQQLDGWVVSIKETERIARELGITTIQAQVMMTKSVDEQKRLTDEYREQKRIKDAATKQEENRIARLKRANEAAKQGARDIVRGLTQEMKIQKLINSGKERQAAIQAAVYQTEGKGFTSEEVNKIAKLRGELFDLQKQGGDRPTARDTISATVSRFLSFRRSGSNEQVAKDNEKNTKRTADNTLAMTSLLQEIVDNQNSGPSLNIQAAQFGV